MPEKAPPSPPGPDDVGGFYDTIAEDYHLAVHDDDWGQNLGSQGRSLEAIIGSRLDKKPPWRVLDCSCGIGTQALGLALLGHDVVGTDLSPRAVERARREADLLGVPATFAVADMRRLDIELEGDFDVVLSCDNSLAHFAPGELDAVLRAMKSKLRRPGLTIVSIRDYDALAAARPVVPNLPRVKDGSAGRVVSFQLWDWEPDGCAYLMTWLFVDEAPTGYHTRAVRTRLHAHRRADLSRQFELAGFVGPQWHMPDAAPGFYQPVLTALNG